MTFIDMSHRSRVNGGYCVSEGRTPSEEARFQTFLGPARFILLLNCCSQLLSFGEIGVDDLSMAKVVDDDEVDVREIEGRIVGQDLLGRGTRVEGVDHRVEAYSRGAHA